MQKVICNVTIVGIFWKLRSSRFSFHKAKDFRPRRSNLISGTWQMAASSNYKGNSSHKSWLNHAQTGSCFDKAGRLFVRGKVRRPRGHCSIFKPPVVFQDEIVVEPILTSHFTSLDTTIVYHSIPLGSGNVLVFERVSKKLGIVPTCGCLKMKLPPLGPQFICLAIRPHTSQIMRIRLDGLAGMGDFHVGCCEDECSRLASG